MSKSLCTAVAVMVATWAQVSLAAWDGSAKVPKVVEKDGQNFYEITSPEELIGYLDSSISSLDKYDAYLKNDIVFGSDTSKVCVKQWVRSSEQGALLNLFDGRGHTIYGLNALYPMFKTVGETSKGIQNLNIANSIFGADTVYSAAAVAEQSLSSIRNVNLYNTNVRAAYHAGGIVAYLYQGSEYGFNYLANSSVVGGSVSAANYVGGLVSYSRGHIYNCSNSAHVYQWLSELVRDSVKEVSYVGGIVGLALPSHGTSITNSVNRGKIEVLSNRFKFFVGGIAGESSGSLVNLENYGDVSLKTEIAEESLALNQQMQLYVGGIVGMKQTSDETRDLFNGGNITVSAGEPLDDGYVYVGGIAGSMMKPSLLNVLNKGNVNVQGYGRELELNVGGVVGFGTFGGASGYSKLKNRGHVSAVGTYAVNVGGVVGEISDNLGEMKFLDLSYNYGNVSGEIANTSSEARFLRVGGVAGYAKGVNIGDVYNRGAVIAKSNEKITGYAGGIVGEQAFDDYSVVNSYSAAPSVMGDVAGGAIGYQNYTSMPFNVYFDKSLVDVDAVGLNRKVADDESYGMVNTKDVYKGGDKTTGEMKSVEMLTLLNTQKGSRDDRGVWTSRGGYPVLTFDSLYKKDSTVFKRSDFVLSSTSVLGDTTVYEVSTAEEFLSIISIAGAYSFESSKIVLKDNIVLGRDSLHLMDRKLSFADSSKCFMGALDGNGFTVYGLNMDRAMFRCLRSARVENLTIANSRFENDYGMSAAGVAIDTDNSSLLRNVRIQNSLVRGTDVVGGLVAQNYATLLDVYNQNTPVYSTNRAGGIVAECNGYIVGASNSGKVVGRIVGGIVGYSYNNNGLIKNASNSGAIFGSGKNSVAAGGIAGYSFRLQVRESLNEGLVEASSDSGVVYVGGIAGRIDSATTISGLGNWGRVHVNGGKQAYAGGLVGWYEGVPVKGLEKPTAGANFMESFNYGPVVVKSVKDSSYAGGLVGYGKLGIFHGDYNRGVVKNEGSSSKKWTGGLFATVENSRVQGCYSYTDILTGDGVGTLAYEWRDSSYVDRYYYGKDLVNAPVVMKGSMEGGTKIYTKVEAKTFDEFKAGSVDFDFFDDGPWYLDTCFPKMKHDSTSTCAVNTVKDYYDTSFADSVGYSEDAALADSTDLQGEGGEGGDSTIVVAMPKVVASLMRVDVAARHISVSGLSENRPVIVMDLQGRLVKSVRTHGSSVNIALSRAGRYIVRSGSQAKIVTVR